VGQSGVSAAGRVCYRLNGLAVAVELGTLSVEEMRDTLLGHIEAIDGVPYSMVKEVQYVWAQLTRAVESGDQKSVDVNVLGDWLRHWAERVSNGSA
jgi:hypothetical protein